MERDNTYLAGNQFAKGRGPNATSFKKGNIPWSKGRKGWSPKGSEKTRFTKGQRPINHKPIGTVTVRVDKSGKPRRWVKIADNGRPQDRWMIYATWLWQKQHGPIPKGMMIHHLDHDSLNDKLSNYALVTRSGHIREHHEELFNARRRNGCRVGKGYVRHHGNGTDDVVLVEWARDIHLILDRYDRP